MQAITNTQRADVSMRTGARATVYNVRRDPILKNETVLHEKVKKDFPYIHGDKYKGEWNQNHKEGFGVQINADGTKYEGEWKQGKRDGRGTLWIKKHKKYVKQYAGEWRSDKKEGYGFYYYDNGDVYRGDWLKNKRSGHGLIEYTNGDVYDGNWSDDKRSGPGTYYVENGNVYEGNWRNDMKEGPGRFFYASTRKVYEGEWLQDSPKCGEFREPRREEEDLFGESSIRRAAFKMPELTLAYPQDVLSCAVADTRLDKTSAKELGRADISPDDIEEAEQLFMMYVNNISEQNIKNSTVESPVTADGPATLAFGHSVDVFDVLGVQLSPSLARDVMEQFEIQDETLLSFPEIADIASFILGVDEEGKDDTNVRKSATFDLE